MFVLSAPSNFLVQRFQNLDSKDLGLWDHQGPPEYGRSCDYREQVAIIAYYSL